MKKKSPNKKRPSVSIPLPVLVDALAERIEALECLGQPLGRIMGPFDLIDPFTGEVTVTERPFLVSTPSPIRPDTRSGRVGVMSQVNAADAVLIAVMELLGGRVGRLAPIELNIIATACETLGVFRGEQ